MITPEYLEQAADQIEKIYTDFQEWAIRDIVNRLLETDFEVSGTTQWRAEKVQQAGLVYNDLTARIAKETGKSKTEIKRLFRDAGVEVYNYGDEVYQGLGIQPLSVRQSPAMLNVLMAGMKKTEKTMKNLTGTTASMAQSQFISACDGAWMAVSSGAVSYNEAVINAVGQVGFSGMWIRYPETGHRDRLDVATRRCVLSGLGRTVGTLNEMACDELGCDLVEVTAHWNARPSHAEWQGLVYSRSGKNKDYPDFRVCGYGTGTGLLGWNCYHDFHPFFEGISERLYTEEQLAEMKNATVKYNGKEIGGYEATQVQRGIERKIRESKRKLIAYDEGIKNSSGTLRDEFRLRYSVESKQLSELNKRLDDFCSQTGFVKQYDRSRVQGFGRSQAQKAVQAGKKSLTGGGKSGIINSRGVKTVQSGAFYGALNPESDKDFKRCEEHAQKYYEEIRKRTSDVETIAHNTNLPQEQIQCIKAHIFTNKYDLGEDEPTTFYPNYDIAVSWQNLIDGHNISEKDIILLNHEYYEYKLMMNEGLSYVEAHSRAQEKYNYKKAVDEWRAKK